MFSQFVRAIIIAATFAGGAVSAVPAVAAPLSVTVTTDQGGDVRVAQRYDRDRRDFRRYDRGCSPRDALRKASRMGIHRAGIVRDGRRAVVVDGRKRGRYVSVAFANVRSCPVIRVR
jgi:hypothetical protein